MAVRFPSARSRRGAGPAAAAADCEVRRCLVWWQAAARPVVRRRRRFRHRSRRYAARLWTAPDTALFGLHGRDGVNGAYCKIHYWFCTASGPDAANKPVVLWLNGGPGSSSILGLLQEHGPLLLNATGGLMVNPYAWTNVANLLVMESPVGVGYSYYEAQAVSNSAAACANTDKYTASASRAALVDFFQTKFPELAGNDFFVTGESYAGIYLPTLASEILQHNVKNQNNTAVNVSINLVGMAVGDPCTDNDAQLEYMDALWYASKHGYVDEAVSDMLWNHCDVRLPNRLLRSDWHKKKKIEKKNNRKNRKGMHHARHRPAEWKQSLPPFSSPHNSNGVKDTPACDLAWKKFVFSTYRSLPRYSLFDPATNAADVATRVYLNRVDVRAALRVTDAPVTSWPYPDAGFDYTSEYDACNADAKLGARSMIDFYRKIAPELPGAIFIYNGDTDPAVSYEGTRTAVKRIGFAEIDGGGYRPWY